MQTALKFGFPKPAPLHCALHALKFKTTDALSSDPKAVLIQHKTLYVI